MFPTIPLTALLLAITVASEPIFVQRSTISLPLSKRISSSGIKNILRHDTERAKSFKSRNTSSKRSDATAVVSTPITNQMVLFSASVGIGNPPTNYELIVDTGSANLWIGANQPYKKTNTSIPTTDTVSVTYGAGSFLGKEFFDEVTLGPGLVIPRQSIGVASSSSGFSGVDGILGLGPTDLTLGTLSPDTQSVVATVVDNLFAEKAIPADMISIFLPPSASDSTLNGEITWGGTDSTKFTGAIHFSPITGTIPSNGFWGINQSISYGTTTVLASTAGIIDTGTTLILIATNAFSVYKKATGGILDSSTGLLRITAAQFSNLKPLVFTTNGASFALPPNGQIWPRSLNSDIGGAAGDIYLIVNDIGSNSGSGLDFINGETFLQRFYSVYDTTNKRVGLATTAFTNATTN